MALDDDELRRALRAALLRIEETRADVLRLAARVVALEEELAARAGEPEALGAAVDAREAEALARIRAADHRSADRLHLGDPVDKYGIADEGGPPCAELIPICGARCCTLDFALSTQDLDEGVIRFDVGRPYLIRHDADGHCSHLDRATRGCGAYPHRPAVCRQYDCRQDRRVWLDYDARVLAPMPLEGDPPGPLDLPARLRMRDVALAGEAWSVRKRV